MDIFNTLADITRPYPVSYKGFTIDSMYRIYKDGRHIFKAHWQRACSLDEAKLTIDMSLLAKEITAGKRIVAAPAVVHDLDFDELEREAEAAKIDAYWDRQNDEHWK